MQPLPEPKIAEIDFDLFVEGHEIPKLAVGLLYHLYPRSGPYEQDGQLETFRPKFLSGRLGASTTARKWKSFLNALHRETIAYLATHTAPIKHKNETKRIDN